MISFEGIEKNFRFLVLEVRRQLETTHRLFDEPTEGRIRGVRSRDSYTDTLKALIEKKCVSFFRHSRTIDRSSANFVTAINVATSNLERIADFCVNVAIQVQKLKSPELLQIVAHRAYFDELREVVPLAYEAMIKKDTTLALRLCQAETTLDQLYDKDYDAIRERLRQGGPETDDLLICLYIVHYLERMGDSLLNIGEAALFAVTGEKIKLHEYLGLRESLESRNPGSSMGDFSIDFNWETRSGCRIAKVEDISQDGSELEAIFKKGQSDKLRKERANIARWEELVPGAPPKVLEFSDGEEDAALLLEFLEGYTLRDLALNADRRVLDDAIGALAAVLRTVWETTRIETPVCAGFVSQALDRIEAVFQLHPEFVNACFEVGSLSVASLEELLERGKAAEQHLSAPFQTLLHGDLNLDNIIYNHRTRRVHLIDLYRSKESDYVQDIATLMISHFRLPVFETAVRNLLAHATVRIYEFAAGYASAHEDKTFDARLALGLARGFLTSTRFEMDATFAREMFARAVYLLEKIIRHDHEQFETFVLNKDIAIH